MQYNSYVDLWLDNRNGLIVELAVSGTKYCDIFTAISAFDFAACEALKLSNFVNSYSDVVSTIVGEINSKSEHINDFNNIHQITQNITIKSMQHTEEQIKQYNEGITNIRRVGLSAEKDFNVNALVDFMRWAVVEENIKSDQITNYYSSKHKQPTKKNKIIELFPKELS